jgi:hypothetical protein
MYILSYKNFFVFCFLFFVFGCLIYTCPYNAIFFFFLTCLNKEKGRRILISKPSLYDDGKISYQITNLQEVRYLDLGSSLLVNPVWPLLTHLTFNYDNYGFT